eukprot:jgi/Tetstr1/454514/TSEL_041413.t1
MFFNATGTDLWKHVFIGKATKPRCFGQHWHPTKIAGSCNAHNIPPEAFMWKVRHYNRVAANEDPINKFAVPAAVLDELSDMLNKLSPSLSADKANPVKMAGAADMFMPMERDVFGHVDLNMSSDNDAGDAKAAVPTADVDTAASAGVDDDHGGGGDITDS